MAAVAAAISAAFSAFAASSVGTFLTTTVIGRLVVSIGASLLLQALAPKPKISDPGIRTSTTQTGGMTSEAFVLGRYATGGSLIAPPMSHGRAGDTPNAFLTYVIELSSVPGCTLEGLIVDDEAVSFGGTPHPDYGSPIGGRFADRAWVRYYDGSQTAADPMLLARYGSYPDRPWAADMVGTGLCYAIMTFRYDRQVFTGLPRVRFVLGGIPLYDPRADTTAGGSGPQRWNDRATWASSANPVVQAYNLLRGVTLPDGSVYGGGFPAADLPLAPWFAAMNECDAPVPAAGGGTEAQYRTGFEVQVAEDEPADVLAELFKASAAQIADVAGIWKPRVGPPGLPVLAFADADIIGSEPEDFAPFPGLDATFNAVHASYPEPESLWETRDAPPRYNPAWEAEDQNRRLVADLALPACPYAAQVQRIMTSYIADERRFRRHALTLPPEALVLEPLDAVAWTSARNGYTAKTFEVTEITADLVTGRQRVGLRERDAADFAAPTLLPSAPGLPGAADPAPQAVPGFAAAGVPVLDQAGTVRGPAIRLSWAAGEADDVAHLRWELRPIGQSFTVSGTTAVAAGEVVITEGVVRSGSYEVRAQLIADRPTEWTAWTAVTAPDVGLLAVFGGTLQSDNFVPGAAGWQITQAGGAAFNGGLGIFGGAIQSANFVTNTTGWRIQQDGTVQFNAGASFRGDLQSVNYVPGVSGWFLGTNGTLEIRNLIQRAAIVDGAVSDRPVASASNTVTRSTPDSTGAVVLTFTLGSTNVGDLLTVAARFVMSVNQNLRRVELRVISGSVTTVLGTNEDIALNTDVTVNLAGLLVLNGTSATVELRIVPNSSSPSTATISVKSRTMTANRLVK